MTARDAIVASLPNAKSIIANSNPKLANRLNTKTSSSRLLFVSRKSRRLWTSQESGIQRLGLSQIHLNRNPSPLLLHPTRKRGVRLPFVFKHRGVICEPFPFFRSFFAFRVCVFAVFGVFRAAIHTVGSVVTFHSHAWTKIVWRKNLVQVPIITRIVLAAKSDQ